MGSDDPTRCTAHGLLLAPDGGCVRCRLDEQKAANARVVIAVVVVFVAGVIAIPVWWFMRQQSGAAAVTAIVPETPVALVEEPGETDEEQEPQRPPLYAAGVVDPWEVLDDDEPIDAGVDASVVAELADGGEIEDGSSPEEQRRALEREKAIERETKNVRVTIYTAPWCNACKSATAWMRANGVYFVERNIESDAYAKERLGRMTSSRALPTIDVEGKILRGFSPRGLRNAIQEVATKRVDQRISRSPSP